MSKIYVYQHHSYPQDLYFSNCKIPEKELYCDLCKTSDKLINICSTAEECEQLVQDFYEEEECSESMKRIIASYADSGYDAEQDEVPAKQYIYQSCCNGDLYTCDEFLDDLFLYCNTCNDYHTFIGSARTRAEAFEVLCKEFDQDPSVFIDFVTKNWDK